MARKRQKKEYLLGERWAVPYADFLSLLLALFIALYAISAQNKAKVEALKMEFIRIFDFPSKPDTLQPVTIIPPMSSEPEDILNAQDAQTTPLDPIIQIQQLQEGGVLEQSEQGITLRLPSDLLFNPGSSEISSQEMIDYLRNISQIIQKLPPQVQVNIRGYTDDAPLSKDSQFRDHFSLAAARAIRVMNTLIQNGVRQDILSFTSYGKNQPLFPNTTPANRSKNNRVDLFFFADPSSGIKNLRSVLDGIRNEGR